MCLPKLRTIRLWLMFRAVGMRVLRHNICHYLLHGFSVTYLKYLLHSTCLNLPHFPSLYSSSLKAVLALLVSSMPSVLALTLFVSCSILSTRCNKVTVCSEWVCSIIGLWWCTICLHFRDAQGQVPHPQPAHQPCLEVTNSSFLFKIVETWCVYIRTEYSNTIQYRVELNNY